MLSTGPTMIILAACMVTSSSHTPSSLLAHKLVIFTSIDEHGRTLGHDGFGLGVGLHSGSGQVVEVKWLRLRQVVGAASSC